MICDRDLSWAREIVRTWNHDRIIGSARCRDSLNKLKFWQRIRTAPAKHRKVINDEAVRYLKRTYGISTPKMK